MITFSEIVWTLFPCYKCQNAYHNPPFEGNLIGHLERLGGIEKNNFFFLIADPVNGSAIPLHYLSQDFCGEKLQYQKVSPGNQPLAKEPKQNTTRDMKHALRPAHHLRFSACLLKMEPFTS